MLQCPPPPPNRTIIDTESKSARGWGLEVRDSNSSLGPILGPWGGAYVLSYF
jgi:hypothetical protein